MSCPVLLPRSVGAVGAAARVSGATPHRQKKRLMWFRSRSRKRAPSFAFAEVDRPMGAKTATAPTTDANGFGVAIHAVSARGVLQSISAIVADAGYDISTISTEVDKQDCSRGHIALTLRRNESTEEGDASADRKVRLLGAIGRLSQVIEVVFVDPDGPDDPGAAPDLGILYLVHDFASSPSWAFDARFAALPRDPYVKHLGVGRFREYSKFRYLFPPPRGVARASRVSPDLPGSEPGLRLKSEVASKSRQGLEEELEPRPEFYVPVNVDAAGGALLEIPDLKFNQPSGYAFSGRSGEDTNDSAAAAPDTPPDIAADIAATPAAATSHPGRYTKTVDRRFRRVSPDIASLPEFMEIIRRFASHVRLDPQYARRAHLDLGVHAIRIVADESAEDVLRGQIVPEGMHRDGFHYVCLLCTGSANVVDWKAYVYAAGARGARPPKGATPLFSHPLVLGSAVFLNDTRVWHDADDIRQKDPRKPGYADFIVVTLAAEDNSD